MSTISDGVKTQQAINNELPGVKPPQRIEQSAERIEDPEVREKAPENA